MFYKYLNIIVLSSPCIWHITQWLQKSTKTKKKSLLVIKTMEFKINHCFPNVIPWYMRESEKDFCFSVKQMFNMPIYVRKNNTKKNMNKSSGVIKTR